MKKIDLWSKLPLVTTPMSDEEAATFYRGLARREGVRAVACAVVVLAICGLLRVMGVPAAALLVFAMLAVVMAFWGGLSLLFARRPLSGMGEGMLEAIPASKLRALVKKVQAHPELSDILRGWLDTGHPIRADQESFLLDALEKRESEVLVKEFTQASNS